MTKRHTAGRIAEPGSDPPFADGRAFGCHGCVHDMKQLRISAAGGPTSAMVVISG